MKLRGRRNRDGIWERRYWKLFNASRRLTREYEKKLRKYENKLKKYENKLQIIHDFASSDDIPQSRRRTVCSLQDDKQLRIYADENNWDVVNKALDRTPQKCEQRSKVIGAQPKSKEDFTSRAVANAYKKHREFIWRTIGADAGVSSNEAEARFWEIGRDGLNSAVVT